MKLNRFSFAAAVAAAGVLLAGAAQAEVGITADLGTTGLGAHMVVPVTPTVNGRFGVNFAKFNASGSEGSIDYDVRARLRTADFLVDWYVRDNNSFHLSAGLVYNGNKFDAKGRPNNAGGYTINGVSYRSADVGTLDGNLVYQKAAPYLGIGWGNAIKAAPGWGFASDIGGFFQGKGKASLASVGCTAAAIVCQAIARDVAVEQASFARQISDVPRIYPVLRAAVSYRF
jgi:hypothetical protein